MDETFNKGYFEVYCGPMKSGKSLEILSRANKLSVAEIPYIAFKPDSDTRDKKKSGDIIIKSRFGSISINCIVIPENNPQALFEYLKNEKVIIFDEIQFFDKKIVDVVRELIRYDKNVIGAGLDTDFRGEPFGHMPELLAISQYVKKLSSFCEYKPYQGSDKCNHTAHYTQRLINGQPAPYDSPIKIIEHSNNKETYEARCLEHHFVPR